MGRGEQKSPLMHLALSENHSVQNSPWGGGGGGSIASSRLIRAKASFITLGPVNCSSISLACPSK